MIEVKKEHLLLAVTFSVMIASVSYTYASLRSYSSSREGANKYPMCQN